MGFEPRSARIGYIYNPDWNLNLLDMPSESPGQDASCLLWDEEAHFCVRNGKLESEYDTALRAHLDALDTTVSPLLQRVRSAKGVHVQRTLLG